MVLLNTADKIYAGVGDADKVYKGDTLVWEKNTAVEPTTTYWNEYDSGVPFSSSSGLDIQAGSAKVGAVGNQITSGVGNISQWNNPTEMTKVVVGYWIKTPTGNTTDIRIFDFRATASSGTVGGMLYTPARNFRFMQATSGINTGQSPAVTANTWYWVTQSWDTVAKLTRFRIYTADGTLFHDSNDVGLTTSYASLTTVRYGYPSSASFGGGTYSMDSPQMEPDTLSLIPPWIPV